MKKIESYAEPPFNGVVVGRDKNVEFYTDHGNKLTQAVSTGAPFGELVSPYMAALAALTASKTDTAVNLAQQGSETMTVDNYILQFKAAVTRLEPRVLIQFPKETVEYHEFFPQGKSAYSNVTKGNFGNLIATIIAACAKYTAKLGPEPAAEFTALRTSYTAARESQLQKKGSTVSTRSAWDTNLETIADLAFFNLLTIAREHRGHPEKLRMYFDQSIITLHKHENAAADVAYTLTVPAAGIAAADISFSVDDTLLISNNGDVSLYYYGAANGSQPAPPTAIEIAAGDEAEVTAASLGAPANRYLLFANKDAETDGEVEITLI